MFEPALFLLSKSAQLTNLLLQQLKNKTKQAASAGLCPRLVPLIPPPRRPATPADVADMQRPLMNAKTTSGFKKFHLLLNCKDEYRTNAAVSCEAAVKTQSYRTGYCYVEALVAGGGLNQRRCWRLSDESEVKKVNVMV